MKNNLQYQASRYIREISLLIPDSYQDKERLLASIRQNLDDFLAEHPDSSFKDIVKEFGTSAEFADSFLDEFSGTEILSFLQKKERHNRFIFLACIFTILSIMLAALGCIYYLNAPFTVEYGDTTYYYNGTEVDYEEFMELNRYKGGDPP